MVTSPSLEANRVEQNRARRIGIAPAGRPLESSASGSVVRTSSSETVDRAEELLYRTLPEVAPAVVLPQAIASMALQRNKRRIISREQGRALEMIGHAVDYLNDCYLYEGDEKEIIHTGGSMTQALGILSAARIHILQSLPLRESRTSRLWNRLLHPAHLKGVATGPSA